MMRHYLETQITARRKRLAALDSERAKLVGELAAYEDALAKSATGSTDEAHIQKLQHEPLLSVSRAWLTVLQRMAGFKYFNASEILIAASALHQEGKLKKLLTNDGVRAQLSNYTRKGILKRRGGGNYLLTDATRAVLESAAKTSLSQSS